MKILCVTSIFPNRLQPNKGIYNWRHFAHLQNEAHLRVISPIAWTDDWRSRRNGAGPLACSQWQEWNGVGVAYPRYAYTPGLFRGLYGTFLKWSIRETFRRAICDFQPNVVYACWAYPDGWAAWRLARDAGLPVVLKVHGSDLLSLPPGSSRRRRTVELLQDLDALNAVSEDLRQCAIRLGTPEHRAHVNYSGTDCDLFFPGDRKAARQALGLKRNGRRLLFVGNLVAIKGISNLIEACRQLCERGLAFEADIVGEGPLHESLQQQIADSGLRERVHLRGRKLQAELPQWYRAADLVVLSSHSEGVPNVLVEAAACGVPFVATNVGGISEIAHLSPVPLVPPNNPGALARAIESVLSNPAAAAAGVEAAGVPSVAACAAATQELFSQVIAERKVTVRVPGRAASPVPVSQ
jgi:glycosyltransferase involved in cell wall biosynthesis